LPAGSGRLSYKQEKRGFNSLVAYQTFCSGKQALQQNQH